MLGNGDSFDGVFNMSDCVVILLGFLCYEWGENMYCYMNLVYGDNYNYKWSIVFGIGYDGVGMYCLDVF